MMPEALLPLKDCQDCLFHREDWRGDGFCYMFRIEPTGDRCGQMRPVAGDIFAGTPPIEGVPPEYPGDCRQASAGCWHITHDYSNSDPHHCRKPCVSGSRYCEEHQGSKRR
jgi:hypothetical protein